MNTYQKKYIRNWLIAIFTIAFIGFNIWALCIGINAVKMVWGLVLVILAVWCLIIVVYGFFAEQVYNFRLRGVCENDNELDFLKMYSWAFHQGKFTGDDFENYNQELVERFLSVKRPKWY